MDANLKVRLYVLEYHVRGTCSSCLHGDFARPADVAGVCRLLKYTPRHRLYDGGERHVEVVRDGGCKFFQRADTLALGDHVEFAVP